MTLFCLWNSRPVGFIDRSYLGRYCATFLRIFEHYFDYVWCSPVCLFQLPFLCIVDWKPKLYSLNFVFVYDSFEQFWPSWAKPEMGVLDFIWYWLAEILQTSLNLYHPGFLMWKMRCLDSLQDLKADILKQRNNEQHTKPLLSLLPFYSWEATPGSGFLGWPFFCFRLCGSLLILQQPPAKSAKLPVNPQGKADQRRSGRHFNHWRPGFPRSIFFGSKYITYVCS